ncbi:uncharacterized protein BO72DRAFT_83176 [Aspergillus fijiensis CBS 313.89]|uniref:Uncharacterized protein n=1 Tax=Aspergillus fijiensis CBS 313.89 TaxID=1448319 RepID=A0A8G1RPR8_9EURO|nr:uncharacterized protein BO72DRAFT_83176 [Aspergillus fijiensis CBS 313.89]RAK77992.1 hypothetical protein BO72DRAFT_83176 [Aspergillus fijiensis CBS 313.89]
MKMTYQILQPAASNHRLDLSCSSNLFNLFRGLIIVCLFFSTHFRSQGLSIYLILELSTYLSPYRTPLSLPRSTVRPYLSPAHFHQVVGDCLCTVQ